MIVHSCLWMFTKSCSSIFSSYYSIGIHVEERRGGFSATKTWGLKRNLGLTLTKNALAFNSDTCIALNCLKALWIKTKTHLDVSTDRKTGIWPSKNQGDPARSQAQYSTNVRSPWCLLVDTHHCQVFVGVKSNLRVFTDISGDNHDLFWMSQWCLLLCKPSWRNV